MTITDSRPCSSSTVALNASLYLVPSWENVPDLNARARWPVCLYHPGWITGLAPLRRSAISPRAGRAPVHTGEVMTVGIGTANEIGELGGGAVNR